MDSTRPRLCFQSFRSLVRRMHKTSPSPPLVPGQIQSKVHAPFLPEERELCPWLSWPNQGPAGTLRGQMPHTHLGVPQTPACGAPARMHLGLLTKLFEGNQNQQVIFGETQALHPQSLSLRKSFPSYFRSVPFCVEFSSSCQPGECSQKEGRVRGSLPMATIPVSR